MKDLYKLLVDIFTAPDLDWRTPVYTGLGIIFVLAILLPWLMPWTGLFPLLLQAILVISGLAGGGFFVAYGGWLWYQERFNPEFRDDLEDEEAEAAPKPRAGSASRGNSPACPKCGGGMKQRSLNSGVAAGKRFWVCKAYPECRGMLPIVDEKG
jgi:hypothetical protein